MAVAATQEPTTIATTTATNYIHNHRILQQIPNPKTSKKKKFKIFNKTPTQQINQ